MSPGRITSQLGGEAIKWGDIRLLDGNDDEDPSHISALVGSLPVTLQLALSTGSRNASGLDDPSAAVIHRISLVKATRTMRNVRR